MVVGGYGAVGRTVCALLAERFPGHVFAARNLAKAEAFSREIGGGVLSLELGLGDPSGAAEALEGARVVVARVEPGDASFAREVPERGIHYVDVWPPTPTFSRSSGSTRSPGGAAPRRS